MSQSKYRKNIYFSNVIFNKGIFPFSLDVDHNKIASPNNSCFILLLASFNKSQVYLQHAIHPLSPSQASLNMYSLVGSHTNISVNNGEKNSIFFESFASYGITSSLDSHSTHQSSSSSEKLQSTNDSPVNLAFTPTTSLYTAPVSSQSNHNLLDTNSLSPSIIDLPTHILVPDPINRHNMQTWSKSNH